MADISQIELSSGEVCDIKDAVAREALGDLYPVLVNATQIPNNSDMNSYLTPGSYFATGNTAATLSNSGITSTGFKMLVMKRNKLDPFLWQIQLAVNANCVIALRYYNGSFGAWKQLTPA